MSGIVGCDIIGSLLDEFLKSVDLSLEVSLKTGNVLIRISIFLKRITQSLFQGIEGSLNAVFIILTIDKVSEVSQAIVSGFLIVLGDKRIDILLYRTVQSSDKGIIISLILLVSNYFGFNGVQVRYQIKDSLVSITVSLNGLFCGSGICNRGGDLTGCGVDIGEVDCVLTGVGAFRGIILNILDQSVKVSLVAVSNSLGELYLDSLKTFLPFVSYIFAFTFNIVVE